MNILYNKDKFFELLKKRNVSNKELSSAIGVSSGNVSDWKSGKSKPNIDALSKIADYLDCSVDYLLGRTNVPEVNRRTKIVSIAEQFENADSAKVAAYGESTSTIKDKEKNK